MFIRLFCPRKLTKFDAMNHVPDFSSFPPSTRDQWESLVKKELGEKPLSSLRFHERSGLVFEPYYTSTSHGVGQVLGFPKGAHILQSVHSGDAAADNALALECLMGGATAIRFTKPASLTALLKDIFFQFAPIEIHTNDAEAALDAWLNVAKERALENATVLGAIYPTTPSAAFSQQIVSSKTRLRSWLVDTEVVHLSGATVTQELAYALYLGHEALVKMLDAGLNIDDASAQIGFRFHMGNSYFIEIAKLRAFRVLWSTIVAQYAPQHACTHACHITGITSAFLQTIPDVHTNLLRGTTQAMSAAIGGANAIEVLPYDTATASASANGYRWARNVMHLLNEESYFDQLQDAASGAYYIEQLTAQIGESAWQLFVDLDRGQLSFEAFVAMSKESGAQWASQVSAGQHHILGVTRFPDKKNIPNLAGTPHRLATEAEARLREGGVQ